MKERLTGAIILVALMVLLVPELLTGPIGMKSSPAGSASIASSSAASSVAAAAPPAAGTAQPAQGAPPLRTYTLTLGAAAPTQSTQATSAATSTATSAGPQAQPAQGQPSASTAQEATPSTPAKPAAAAAQAPGQGKALRHAAAPEPTKPRSAAARPASRVLPSPSHARRKSPDRPALQVNKPAAHRTVREARAPASASGRGWVVQLGVFADHRNAVRLAGTLERRGFRIAVSPLRVRSRSLWRVSTTPQSRAAALHVAARLRAAGHRGDVLPAR